MTLASDSGPLMVVHALLWCMGASGWLCLLYQREAKRAGLDPRQWHPAALDSHYARAAVALNILAPIAALGFLISLPALLLSQGTALLAATLTVHLAGLRLRPIAMALVLGSLVLALGAGLLLGG